MKKNEVIVNNITNKVMKKLAENKRRALVENIANKVMLKIKLNENLVSEDNLACYLPPSKNNGEEKWAVLYDASYVLQNLETVGKVALGYHDPYDPYLNNVIRGMIQLLPTGWRYGNCNNAWQVGAIAGPGYGKYLYQIGFALAPEDELTPDRKIVKIGARKNWRKQFDSGERKKNPFDNKEAPKTPPTEDDCIFHKDQILIDPQTWEEIINPKTGEPEIENVDQLNYSYETKPSDESITKKLIANHEDTFNMVKNMIAEENILLYGDKAEQLTKKIYQAIEIDSQEFFRKHYDPYSI